MLCYAAVWRTTDEAHIIFPCQAQLTPLRRRPGCSFRTGQSSPSARSAGRPDSRSGVPGLHVRRRARTHAGTGVAPKAVEVVIRQLQDRANHARFINGENMWEYPEPYQVRPERRPARSRRRASKKKTASQQAAPPKESPAPPPGDPSGTEPPSSAN